MIDKHAFVRPGVEGGADPLRAALGPIRIDPLPRYLIVLKGFLMEDSVSMPVQPIGIGFEGLSDDFIPFRPLGVGDDGLYYYVVTLPEGVLYEV